MIRRVNKKSGRYSVAELEGLSKWLSSIFGNHPGRDLSVWDLHKLTGLSIKDVLAGLYWIDPFLLEFRTGVTNEPGKGLKTAFYYRLRSVLPARQIRIPFPGPVWEPEDFWLTR